MAFGISVVSDIDAVGALEVDVYKTARRPQTFLYVPRDLQPDQWPSDLAELFAAPQKVLSLTLTAEQPLAAQSATVGCCAASRFAKSSRTRLRRLISLRTRN